MIQGEVYTILNDSEIQSSKVLVMQRHKDNGTVVVCPIVSNKSKYTYEFCFNGIKAYVDLRTLYVKENNKMLNRVLIIPPDIMEDILLMETEISSGYVR